MREIVSNGSLESVVSTERVRKVLFLIPSVDSGGIETYLLRFLKIHKLEIDPFVLIRNTRKGNLLEEYKKLSIPMFFLPLGYINPYRCLKYFIFFRRNSFDTICDFNGNFAGLTMWLAYFAGIEKRITSYRQGSNHFNSSFLKKSYNFLVNRLVFNYSTTIIFNSRSALNVFFPNSVPGTDSRFKVIYNGINTKELLNKVSSSEIRHDLGIDLNAFVIGHVGRYDKTKNHTTILKVAERLIRKHPSVFLVLCGPGTCKLSEIVHSLGIDENVRLLGYRSDVPSILKSFDVFYFPSVTEGQPNALLEAMAMEIPVIASNIEPIREIMPDNAMLTDPYDIDSTVSLIEKLMMKSERPPTVEFSQYIVNNFNSRDRFNDFLRELI